MPVGCESHEMVQGNGNLMVSPVVDEPVCHHPELVHSPFGIVKPAFLLGEGHELGYVFAASLSAPYSKGFLPHGLVVGMVDGIY